MVLELVCLWRPGNSRGHQFGHVSSSQCCLKRHKCPRTCQLTQYKVSPHVIILSNCRYSIKRSCVSTLTKLGAMTLGIGSHASNLATAS